MEKKNNFFAKSGQLNIIGLIGCALAVIGILLPVLSVNVYITSVGISHFEMTALVIIPLLLILGAAALYVLKMDKLAMIAAAAAFVAYLLIVFLCRSGSSTISIMGQEISLDELLEQIGSGLNFGFGFYLSILGYLAAIAGAFVNGKIFKAKAGAVNAPDMQFGRQNMPQNPYMAQPQNPYMNQPQASGMGQPQNPYMNQPQAPGTGQPQNPGMGQPQNPYMNQPQGQNPQQMNPHLQQNAPQMPQGAQQMNPYLQQGMPGQMPQEMPGQMGQSAPQKSSFAQQMQQAGQAVRKSLKKSDVNPYVQQAKQQAEQTLQDNIPNESNNQ